MRKATPRRIVAMLALALPFGFGAMEAAGAPAGTRRAPIPPREEAAVNDCEYPSPPSAPVRAADFRRMLSGRPARELPDGWEFVFPGDDTNVAWLVETVQHERGCSQLFQFEISFGRNEEEVRFRIRGGAAAKAVVGGWLETAAVRAVLVGGAQAIPLPE